jgi:sulfofructose kinase
VPRPIALLPAADRPFDVVGLGQNSVDLVAVLPEFPASNSKHRIQRFARLPGGQVASAMVCCARLGHRARYIGRFGDDELGGIGVSSLLAEGVDLAAAGIVSGAHTRFAIILVDGRTGDRTVLWERDPRLAETPETVPSAVVMSARALLVDCDDVEASVAAARIARAHGVVTVIDVEASLPGLDDLLPLIDVIIASEGFPERYSGEAATGAALRALAARFDPAMVCVTLGPGGSLALVDDREVRTPAFPITCVDSTGAGDAFRGGFISALLRFGWGDPEHLLRFANAVAALKCRKAGAREGLPRPAEVEALLAGTAVTPRTAWANP